MTDPFEYETGDFERLPGLFRAWEIQHILDAGSEFQIEDAGPERCDDTLFVVYRRLKGPLSMAAAGLAAGGKR